MVVARPPEMMLDGRIEWIPVFDNRCLANLIPTLSAVGKVIGIEVDNRSINNTNIFHND